MKHGERMFYIGRYDSPLGAITLASEGDALVGLWFDGQRHDRSLLRDPRRPAEYEQRETSVLTITRRWLDVYFSGQEPEFTPTLKLSGTPFRRLVAGFMLTIPYGKTTSYGELARRVAELTGQPRVSAQAVGGAVGHNAISLVIPCHRVVGADGSLVGYGGGLERKRQLILLEKTQRQTN